MRATTGAKVRRSSRRGWSATWSRSAAAAGDNRVCTARSAAENVATVVARPAGGPARVLPTRCRRGMVIAWRVPTGRGGGTSRMSRSANRWTLWGCRTGRRRGWACGSTEGGERCGGDRLRERRARRWRCCWRWSRSLPPRSPPPRPPTSATRRHPGSTACGRARSSTSRPSWSSRSPWRSGGAATAPSPARSTCRCSGWSSIPCRGSSPTGGRSRRPSSRSTRNPTTPTARWSSSSAASCRRTANRSAASSRAGSSPAPTSPRSASSAAARPATRGPRRRTRR